MDQATFIDMNPLSRDSGFADIAGVVGKGSGSLGDWLAETWTNEWSTINES